MKILITGANGQLGNEISVKKKQYPDWQFLLTDIDTLDITNENDVLKYFQNNKPDFIVNCAAYTAVDKAEDDAETAEKINSLAPKMLGKYSKEFGAKIIHVSTDYVFDGLACVPYSENSKVNPQNIYGSTKLHGEINVQKENQDSLVIRTSWLYSSFGNNFVKTMIRLGKEKESVKVVFDQVGTPTYAADLAATVLYIIKKSEINSDTFIPGIYHYSNEGVASWYDFANAIFELSDIECKISPVLSKEFPSPVKRPNFSVLDKSKIRNTFDIEIPYWKDSLKVCIEEFKKI